MTTTSTATAHRPTRAKAAKIAGPNTWVVSTSCTCGWVATSGDPTTRRDANKTILNATVHHLRGE